MPLCQTVLDVLNVQVAKTVKDVVKKINITVEILLCIQAANISILSVIELFERFRDRFFFQKTPLKKLFNHGFHICSLAYMMHDYNSSERRIQCMKL